MVKSVSLASCALAVANFLGVPQTEAQTLGQGEMQARQAVQNSLSTVAYSTASALEVDDDGGWCTPNYDLYTTFYPSGLDPAVSWPHGTVKNSSQTRLKIRYNQGQRYPCQWVETEREGWVLFLYTSWTGTNSADCCREYLDGFPDNVYSGFRVDFTMAQSQSLSQLAKAYDYRVEYGKVVDLYRAFFGRDPDLAGAKFWIAQHKAGKSISTIAEEFFQSEEFQQRYARYSNESLIVSVHQTTFGRTPDQESFRFWQQSLGSGEQSPAAFVQSLSTSPELDLKYPAL